ncbi:Tripartite tricarboxylate transporter TctB family protein [Caballeronia sordidicola]|uniref:Tripartite tricarboxylate transporter TctB family protein n=1 Tax=Caballeronia sordidicola TaxID=196367 RepID=A0A158G677_CABSO|nr:tripartite tricarboxylate transporter TctB family protein [Caballeronia sordidicola]SAL27614.1 Tripartite tricarboxylate transporter TctB family protein [Caballeronia sordidicola]
MKSIKGDVQLAIGVIVVALVYLYMDMRLPEMRLGDPLGPKAFPALVGVGLISAALLLLLEHRSKMRAPPHAVAKPSADEPGTNASGDAPKHNPLILVGMVVWTAFYYVCFERVGYLIATSVFLFGLLSYFNRERHKTNIAVALGFTLVFDLLFSLVLGVPMPAGLLSI